MLHLGGAEELGRSQVLFGRHFLHHWMSRESKLRDPLVLYHKAGDSLVPLLS